MNRNLRDRIKVEVIKRKFFLLFLLLFSLLSANAADLIELRDVNSKYAAMSQSIAIFEDSSRQLTIKDVSSKDFHGFKQNLEKYPYGINKNVSSAYWVKFDVKSYVHPSEKWIIYFYNRHVDQIEFFIPGANGEYHKQIAGHRLPYSQWKYEFDDVVFDIPADGTIQTFYFRVVSGQTSGLSNRIVTFSYYASRSKEMSTKEGVLFGVILLLVLYNLFLFFGTREFIYLAYCLYVVSAAVYLLEKDALAFQRLWPNAPAVNDIVDFAGIRLLVFCLWLYARSVLKFFNVYKRSWFVDLAIIGYLILHLFSYFVPWSFSEAIILHGISDIIAVTILCAWVIKCVRKMGRETWPVIIGFGYVPLSFSLSLIQLLDISSHPFISPSFSYGFLLDAILFSYANSRRVQKLKKEKEHGLELHVEQLEENKRIRERVNKELELLVAQKTTEIEQQKGALEEANGRLIEQSDQINNMNLQLDLDNRDLSKKVAKISRARVLQESGDQDDFKISFPDDRSCYVYLSDQKWGHGFTCVECGSGESTKGQKPFSKRCTKCHHQESIRSNTLLQGSKINIHKAFYLVYLLTQSDGRLSSYKLEELTGVSRKSCASFKKNVVVKIEQLKSVKKKVDMKHVLLSSNINSN